MRRNQNPRMTPKWMFSRKWLYGSDVQGGTADFARLQCLQEIGFNKVLAATHVDELHTGAATGKYLVGQGVASLTCQGKHIDQDMTLPHHPMEFVSAHEGLHAVEVFRSTTPSKYLKSLLM